MMFVQSLGLLGEVTDMPIMVNKWADRLLVANRSKPRLRIIRLTLLRDDIDALADSLFRAGYSIHTDVVAWLECMNNEVSNYKAG